mgnify:CR=1 FL=1
MLKEIMPLLAGKDQKVEQRKIPEFFTELIRLATEADTRFKEGKKIQALSSLAAIPSLHKILVDGCTNESADQSEIQEENHGVYL